MKKTIVIIFVFATLFIPTLNTIIAHDEKISIFGPDLQIGIFGASIAGGLKRAGFVIYNSGNESILDINWIYSIKSITHDDINYSYFDELELLENNSAYLFSTPDVNGFGLVTLLLNVSSLNAGNKTISIKGFQIGPYTISRPWILAWIDI
jgi:hypothetical protein